MMKKKKIAINQMKLLYKKNLNNNFKLKLTKTKSIHKHKIKKLNRQNNL